MKLKLYNITSLVILNLIVFQDVIKNYLHLFTYFDELLTFIIFIYGLSRILVKRNIEKIDLFILGCVCLYYLLGWVSFFLYRYQEIQVTFKASLLAIKFFLLLLGTKWIKESRVVNVYFWKGIKPAAYVTMVLFGICVLISFCFDNIIGLTKWDICAKCVFLIAIYFMGWDDSKYDKLFTLLGIVLLFSTLKAKAYAAIALTLVIYVWIIKMKKSMRIRDMLIVGGVAVAVAWEKIYYYYVVGNNSFARSLLTITGIKIANDYFPFGTGWGSYATYYSELEYSPVYFLYGLSEHRELGYNVRKYMTDTYWPAVLGETGYIGVICILLIIVLIYFNMQKSFCLNRVKYAAGMFVLLYMLVTTFEESGFMQPVLMCLAIIIGRVMSNTEDEIQ